MSLFVSYTRTDEALVRVIREDLERLGRRVWMDHQIHGGESWWREIITEIQQAQVFVFALSNHSWRSKPCRLELRYAESLGIPVLPLQVGPLKSMFIPLAERQIIDYRGRSADAVVRLVAALSELTARPVVLPDPLPEPPQVPFEYLYRIASVLGPDRISVDAQEELIIQLRRKLREEDDQAARGDIVKLLHELAARNELTVQNSREIEEILAAVPPETVPDPDDDATRLPPGDQWQGGAELDWGGGVAVTERTAVEESSVDTAAPKPATPTPAERPAAPERPVAEPERPVAEPERPVPAPEEPAPAPAQVARESSAAPEKAPATEPEPVAAAEPEATDRTGTATVPSWLADIIESGGPSKQPRPTPPAGTPVVAPGWWNQNPRPNPPGADRGQEPERSSAPTARHRVPRHQAPTERLSPAMPPAGQPAQAPRGQGPQGAAPQGQGPQGSAPHGQGPQGSAPPGPGQRSSPQGQAQVDSSSSAGRGLAVAGGALGAVGTAGVVVGVGVGGAVPVALMFFLTVLGVSLGGIAVARRAPGGRAAIAVAGVGLVVSLALIMIW